MTVDKLDKHPSITFMDNEFWAEIFKDEPTNAWEDINRLYNAILNLNHASQVALLQPIGAKIELRVLTAAILHVLRPFKTKRRFEQIVCAFQRVLNGATERIFDDGSRFALQIRRVSPSKFNDTALEVHYVETCRAIENVSINDKFWDFATSEDERLELRIGLLTASLAVYSGVLSTAALRQIVDTILKKNDKFFVSKNYIFINYDLSCGRMKKPERRTVLLDQLSALTASELLKCDQKRTHFAAERLQRDSSFLQHCFAIYLTVAGKVSCSRTLPQLFAGTASFLRRQLPSVLCDYATRHIVNNSIHWKTLQFLHSNKHNFNADIQFSRGTNVTLSTGASIPVTSQSVLMEDLLSWLTSSSNGPNYEKSFAKQITALASSLIDPDWSDHSPTTREDWLSLFSCMKDDLDERREDGTVARREITAARLLLTYIDLQTSAQREACPFDLNMFNADSSVNARVIGQREFTAILELLSAKNFYLYPELHGATDAVQPLLVCRLLVTLMFKCGLRPKEALGLLCTDVTSNKETEIHVAPNRLRSLKTKNALRRIPAHALLTTAEQANLLQQKSKSLKRVGSPDAPLFPDSRAHNRAASQQRFFSIINRAIRLATSDNKISAYALRHSFGTRLVLNLLAVEAGLVDHKGLELLETVYPSLVITAKERNRIRHALIGRSRPTQKVLHAVSMLMGHSSPAMTLEHYVHSLDGLWYCALETKTTRPSVQSLAAYNLSSKSSLYRENKKGTLDRFIVSKFPHHICGGMHA